MKLIYYILSILSIATITGCSNDDSQTLSNAVLASANEIKFEANGSTGKMITVYADADWIAEVPEWVTISPSEGTGTTDVTISVTDNMRDGTPDRPRKATLVFKGATLASRAEVIVSQDGDKYRDCQEYPLSELAALEDESVVAVSEALVAAVTTQGFIATDAQNGANIFMQSSASVKVGNKVNLKGSKQTDEASLAYIACDEVNVTTQGSPIAYPAATDITNLADTYKTDSRTFVSATGILTGNTLTISGAKNQILLSDAPESLGLSALNGHKVTVKGYFAGVAAPVVKIMAAQIEDLGSMETIYFSDDFEWMDKWAVASNAGQTVESDGKKAEAPRVTTNDALGEAFLKDLEETHGYKLIYRNAKNNEADAVYLQKNYLKFGKGSYEAGIVLPVMENIPAGEKLILAFDWSPMISGKHNYDKTQLVVLATQNGKESEIATLTHSQQSADKMKWLHAEVTIDRITITKDTRITIRSKEWDAEQGSYRRWFLDNIKLKKAAE